jgi:DNA-binding MarR family transcriptional regulator
MPYFSMHILIPIFSISGFTLIFYSYTLFLILFLILKNPKETAEIKKKILDLSTKLTRVEVKEISERVKIDKDTVKKIMKEMVQRKEVFGKYFSTSRALVFNQKANIDEIEQLMEIYRE